MSNFPPPAPPYLGPPHSFSQGDNSNPRYNRIVLHGTVSPCVAGGARQIATFFRSATTGSAHYVTDPKEAVQAAYDKVICWHAPPNPNSLGIEMCDPVGVSTANMAPMSRWSDANHAAMLDITADLTADLCLAYDIPAVMLSVADLRAGKRGICEHHDVSLAFGQSTHWDLGLFPRRKFLKLVRAKIHAKRTTAAEKAGQPVPPAPPTKTVTHTRPDRVLDNLRAARKLAKGKVLRREIQSCIDYRQTITQQKG